MADVRELIGLARLRVSVCWPQLADAVWALRGPIEVEGLYEKAGGAIAVDVDWRVYVDPARAASFTIEQMATALVHEAWHCLRDHAARVRACPDGPEWRAAKAAAIDAEVDGDMDRCQPPPSWPYRVCMPVDLGLPAGLSWEQYYAAAKRRIGPTASTPELGGSCMGGDRRCWELPADDEELPGTSEIERRALRETTARAIQQRGSESAGVLRWAGEILAPPRVPWQRVLSRLLRGAASATAGMADYSRLRTSRRQAVTPVLLPVLAGPEFRADVLVDTSGSMDERALLAALVEVQGIIRAAGAAVRLYACDACVHGGVQRVRRASQVQLRGGGGTDMRVGVAFAERQRPRADVLVVVTDAWSPWPVKAPRMRTIVCLVGDHAGPDRVPRWAQVVVAGKESGANRRRKQ